MKATLTIDSHLAKQLQREAYLSKKSFQEIVNETLKKGLKFISKTAHKPYQTTPHSSPFLPDINQNKLNQLADELEIQEELASYHRNDHS